MLNLSSIMVGTMQLDTMVEFYNKIFDREPVMVDEAGSGWMVGECFFSVMEHSEMGGPSKDPGRIMITLATAEVKEEFERMKNAGATPIKEPYEMQGMWIATLADPDNNYFQLMTPWEDSQEK